MFLRKSKKLKLQLVVDSLLCFSETADSRAAPNLSRVLESDSDSARAQDPQETHENSSDFDFSSGPK